MLRLRMDSSEMNLDRFKGQYLKESEEDKERQRRLRESTKNVRLGFTECSSKHSSKHLGAYGDR